MKKILGLCLVVLLSSASLFAQDGRRGQRDHSVEIERTIKDLNLNEDQAVRYRAIENEYMEKMRADRERMEANRDKSAENRQEMEARKAEWEKMHNERNARMQEILSAEQYQKYLEKQPRPGERPKRR